MSLAICRIRNAAIVANWELTLAVALTALAVVLVPLWFFWTVTGDPTVHSYIDHTMLVPTSGFTNGFTATDLHNGWTALAAGDRVAYSFPWLVAFSPVVGIASAICAGVCYVAYGNGR